MNVSGEDVAVGTTILPGFVDNPAYATLGSVGTYDDGPKIVIWEMTRACALACKHCARRRFPGAIATTRTDEAFALVDQVAAIDQPILILTGGDPFMRPDLFDIVAQATARGLRVAVSPSGTARLTKAALDRTE